MDPFTVAAIASAASQLVGALFGGESEREKQSRLLLERLTDDYLNLRRENDDSYKTAFTDIRAGRSEATGVLRQRQREAANAISGIYNDAATSNANIMRAAAIAAANGRNFDIGSALSQNNQNLGQQRIGYEAQLNEIARNLASIMSNYDNQLANLSIYQAQDRTKDFSTYNQARVSAIQGLDDSTWADRLAAGIGGGSNTFANLMLANYYNKK